MSKAKAATDTTVKTPRKAAEYIVLVQHKDSPESITQMIGAGDTLKAALTRAVKETGEHGRTTIVARSLRTVTAEDVPAKRIVRVK